jgi:glycosyltransferase involved in cell wall biosynthesis
LTGNTAGRLVFAYPGDLATITGGYIYDTHLITHMRACGAEIERLPLGAALPGADKAAFAEAVTRLAAVARGVPIVADGLALCADPRLAKAASARGPLIALVHHPLALETGLVKDEAVRLHASEKAALGFADRIVVTSEPTSRTLLADYAVDPARLSIAKPGNERPSFAKGSGGPNVALLSVAAISPRKGFDVLMRALSDISHLNWRMDLVGNEAVDPACARALRQQITDLRLETRIRHWGALDQSALALRYDAADLFVLASLYEGYGMVYSEAIAHGLPVIGTTGGAIPSVVPPDAGLLAEPGDVTSLVAALTLMITDEAARSRFAAGAREAAARLPTWDQTAHIMLQAVAAAKDDWSQR